MTSVIGVLLLSGAGIMVRLALRSLAEGDGEIFSVATGVQQNKSFTTLKIRHGLEKLPLGGA